MTVCKHVRYRGHVQGVGFRYTVRNLAENLPIAGHVRNLPDGSVEVVAQGDATAVGQFLQAINDRMAGYIEQRDVSEATPTAQKRFVILYS